jgi:hypothetical protein
MRLKLTARPCNISAILCFFLTLWSSVGLAQRTVFVNTAAPAGGNGTTWTAAYNDLTTALANALPGDSLFIAGGTYRTANDRNLAFSIPDRVMLYGGFGGTENYSFQRTGALGATVLSGDLGIQGNNADNNYTVVEIRNVIGVILDGLEIRDGNENRIPGTLSLLPPFNPETYWGGGIYALSSSFDLTNCTIANCRASSGGGAIYTSNCPQVNIINCTLENNEAIGGGLPGFEGGFGGAIYQENSTLGLVGRTIIRNNRARLGGGVYYAAGTLLNTGPVPVSLVPPVTSGLAINRLLLQGNEATEDGGGMYISDGLIELNEIFFGAIFRNNSAGRDGGGAFILDRETPFGFSLFENNQAARRGGGMAIATGFVPKKVSLINSIFANNQAQFGGGVAFFHGTNNTRGVLELRHCSMVANTVPGNNGAGLHLVDANLQTINTLFWANRANNAPNSYRFIGSGSGELYHNALEDAACPPGTTCNSACIFGQNPQLLGPANPYSSVGTLEDTPYIPLPASPLVDAGGDPSDFTPDPTPRNDYEQDYMVAHRTCVPDIGAVEMRRMLRQSGTWNNANSWTPQSRDGMGTETFSVPANQNVLIDRVAASIPAGLTTPTAYNVYLNNCQFTMGDNSQLSVGRDFAVTGQATQFEPGNGTASVAFVPRNDCSPVANGPNYINHEFLDNRLTFNYILVQNSRDLISASSIAIHVRRLIDLQQGDFQTADNLVMLSNQNTTAMVVNGANLVTGRVLVQRFIEAYPPDRVGGLGYNYVSRPVSGGSTNSDGLAGAVVFEDPGNPYYWQNPFYTLANFPNVFKYIEGENTNFEGGAAPQSGWRGLGVGEAYEVGRGYCINVPTNLTLRNVGPLNNGNISVPVTRGGAAQSGWNLIGNPYPSPIDWDAVYNLGGNSTLVERTLLRRIATGRFSGSWAYYPANIPGGMGINGGKDVALGQGFLVRALGSGNLQFDNTVRPTAFLQQRFYRPEEGENLGCTGIVRLEAGTTSGPADQTVVYFMPGAEAGLDQRHDVAKQFANSAAPNLFTQAGGQRLAYNALPTLAADVAVPLSLAAVAAGEHYLRIDAEKFFAPGTGIFLEDRAAGAFHDLRASAYRFRAAPGPMLGRFVLHVRPGAGAGPGASGLVTGWPNPVADGRLSLAVQHPALGPVSVRVADTFGREVLSRQGEKAGPLWELALDTSGLRPGVYQATVLVGGETLNYRFVKE